jgi:hypothetical protein
MVSEISKAELPFKDETGAQGDLFPNGLLNTFVKTPSEMTRWPSTAGNNPGALQSLVRDRWRLSLMTRAATSLEVRPTKTSLTKRYEHVQQNRNSAIRCNCSQRRLLGVGCNCASLRPCSSAGDLQHGPRLQFANLPRFKRSAIHGRWKPRI